MLLLKIVPDVFINENRDEREIIEALRSGYCVKVLCKEAQRERKYPYPIVEVSTRPLFPYVKNLTINRLFSIFTWAHKARTLKANVISCHDLSSLAIGWFSRIGQRHKPYLIYDSHEYEYGRNTSRSRFSRALVKYTERFFMKRARYSMMVNDSIADRVQELHHLKERPIVVRNIPEQFDFDDKVVASVRQEFLVSHGFSQDTFICMYHGVLTKGRGIENDIRALAKTENTVLYILGNDSGTNKAEYERIAKECGVTNRVIFHPAVTKQELWKHVAMADVGLIILPNICESYYLSLPNKFFENIHSMTPIICSRFPEFERLVKNYQIGICVEPEDIDGIASAINDMRIDKAQYSKYKENLARARAELCWENERKVLENMYKSMLY